MPPLQHGLPSAIHRAHPAHLQAFTAHYYLGTLISDMRTHHARTQAETRRWFAKFIIALDLTSRLAFNTYVLQYVCLGLEMRGGLSAGIFSWYGSIVV